MSLLAWRPATPDDRADLQAFECTHSPTRMKVKPWREMHDRPWELSLQREIHTVSPKCNAMRAVLLGYDDDGLAAVTVAERLDGPDAVIIECVAVAMRRRGQGGGSCGEEAIDEAIEWALAQADRAGRDRVLVIGKTDPQNDAGQDLMRRTGFGVSRKEDDAIWWQQTFELV